jgi:hypothetical protein
MWIEIAVSLLIALKMMNSESTSAIEQPGVCPKCFIRLPDSVGSCIHWTGTWSGVTSDGHRTGGSTLSTNCPNCGVVLTAFLSGALGLTHWEKIPWTTEGTLTFVGDDWRRGRPGVWREENSEAFRGQLCESLANHCSLEFAILKLHCTSGLGVVHLAFLVRQVQDCSEAESLRIVLRAISPSLH